VNGWRLIAALAMVLASSIAARAQEKAPADLVLVQQGALPIILTAPHGGRESVPGLAPRDITNKPKGNDPLRYVVGTDFNTDVIVQGIAREIEQFTGKACYMVMARFQRKFIDANRVPDVAYDDPSAEPYYRYYHDTIRRFVDDVRDRYPAGILIDVHGQSKMPGALIRGTHNGKTVTRLLARAGVEALTGLTGLYGQLEANGFVVFPPNVVPLEGKSENAGFLGGFTLYRYGSNNPNGIDAVLFEFGSEYRQRSELDITVKRAGKSIAAFYATYLKAPGAR
jgi:N-formylglutamate amidohydrolase